MILSEIGQIVFKEWIKTPEIRPDMNLKLDAFCIMPNHFHAIIFIGENKYNIRGRENGGKCKDECVDDCTNDCDNGHRDAMHRVSTAAQCIKIPSAVTIPSKNQFGPQSKNLSSIIRGFKSSVTVQVRKTNEYFAWQSRFHDHIIHNKIEYYKIRDYIIENPKRWNNDIFYDE
ncbi:MAG: hypothetical protein JW973_10770 [Bacteroidales bacterium]|nr:hypothetical protein [Bacteroidales bacterium]